MTPATKSFGIVGLRLENNQGPWLRIAGLGVCSLLSMLLMSDDSWAAPKKGNTSVTCRCTCMYQDELGKVHYGPSQGVQFTESTGERCLGHTCKSGSYSGTTRDCLFSENPNQMRIPPGGGTRAAPADTGYTWRDGRPRARDDHATRRGG